MFNTVSSRSVVLGLTGNFKNLKGKVRGKRMSNASVRLLKIFVILMILNGLSSICFKLEIRG